MWLKRIYKCFLILLNHIIWKCCSCQHSASVHYSVHCSVHWACTVILQHAVSLLPGCSTIPPDVLGAYGGRGVYLSNANLEKLISDHSGFFTLVSLGNPVAIYTSPFRMLHATLQSSAEPTRQHGMIMNSPESLKTPTTQKKSVFRDWSWKHGRDACEKLEDCTAEAWNS